MSAGEREGKQSPSRELMIQPVYRSVLEVGEGIVPSCTRQLMLGKHRLLLPGIHVIPRIRTRSALWPVATLHGLAPVPPGCYSLCIDDLSLDVKAADEEGVAGILQVREDRPAVLSHQNGMGRIVVDTELVADAMLFTDSVQRNPCGRRVSDVVVPIVSDCPAGHRALFESVREIALFSSLQERNEVRLEVEKILVHAVLLITTNESADRVDSEQHRCVED